MQSVKATLGWERGPPGNTVRPVCSTGAPEILNPKVGGFPIGNVGNSAAHAQTKKHQHLNEYRLPPSPLEKKSETSHATAYIPSTGP